MKILTRILLLLLVIVFLVSQPSVAAAMSAEQRTLYREGITYYDLDTDNCTDGGTTTLAGKDNEERVWNFFRGHGLSEAQTAGVMGNLMQESHFDPEVMEIGGRSKNPSDAGSKGWGIIQWTPGSKVVDMAKQAGVSGPIYELATQLDLVWQHMHNNPVVTQPFDFDHFKSITDAQEAASYFGSQIEGYGVAGGRYTDVPIILAQFKGNNVSTTINEAGAGSCASQSASLTPDCNNANGNAAILCEAKKYDPVNYVSGGGHGGGTAYHNGCPTIKANDTSCGLDCSGLVSVAIYDAFHNDVSWTTYTIASDNQNWKEIPLSQVKPGDLVEPNPDHVEIIDHVSGNTLNTFGAHTASVAQSEQVGAVTWTASSGYHYYRYIGKGSS